MLASSSSASTLHSTNDKGLAPTFADLAGIDFDADGRSLAPLLHGEDPSWRSAVLLEGFAKRNKGGANELESAHENANPALIEALQTRLDALRNCTDTGCQESEDRSLRFACSGE